MIEFTRIPISQLKRKLAQATGSTYAIVGSCPGQHMAEVRKTIKGNKNVQETFGSAEDLANNLAAVDLGGGGAGVRSLATHARCPAPRTCYAYFIAEDLQLPWTWLAPSLAEPYPPPPHTHTSMVQCS